jgi:hypothetical protein
MEGAGMSCPTSESAFIISPASVASCMSRFALRGVLAQSFSSSAHRTAATADR